MAEGIISCVMQKLTDAVVNEFLLQHGIGDQVGALSRELSRLQAFLKDVDKKQIRVESQKHWMKEIRELAYSIEDVIDNFLSEVDRPKPGIFWRMIKRLKTIPAQYKLGDEISKIQARIQEMHESRVRYDIDHLGTGSGGIRLPIRPPVLPNIDPEIVGFEADQKIVLQKLLDQSTTRRSVASIWGPGGLGKTTLAQKVYNSVDVRTQFELRIWVAISQRFELINLLRKIMRQIPVDFDEHSQENEYYLTKLYESLRGKKYLIVLDDVWTTDLWMQIGVALPDELNGSRVLVTTRFLGIARSTNSSCEPHKPQYLNEQLSLELFLKKALPNHDPNQPYDHDLFGIAEKFAKKCGGLPLALVVLGGYLSKRQPKYNDWRKALKTLNWHADGTECIEIIASSYDDLPYALKSCFMYFAAFPEDYDIDALQVIRMWVAEGFIPQEENRTFEDTAESFLEDLVQRGLIQATQRSNNGSILYCRIHDLLRDVAIQKAKEENVFMVCSNPDEQRSFNGARRVAVHDPHFNELVKGASRNLRSLLCFSSQIPNCCEYGLLKVLYCPDAFLETFESLEGLTQLKYLNFRIQIGNKIEYFQGLIGRMRFMQTLDLTVDYANGDILENIWHIKTLRHVALNYLTPPQSCTSFLGPPLSEKQSNLQTLVGVTCRESWIQEPPKLPNLRDLEIYIPQGFPWSVIVTLLGTLRHLVSLAIWGFDIPINIVNMTGFSFYEHLQNMDLVEWSSTALALELNAGFFPIHLNRLSIVGLRLRLDPMPVLETLRHLKYLNIWKTKIKRMTCSATGFQQLEELKLFKLDDIEELNIEVGALPMLKKLEVGYCDRLGVPQGLQHLTNLHELQWFFGSNVVATTQANEIRNLCQHVPSICISGAGISF